MPSTRRRRNPKRGAPLPGYSVMSPVVVTYVWLAIAIVLEVIGTTFLHKSEQFTRLGPAAVTLACYGGAFYFLSLSLRLIPVGLAYAIWSGLGIVLISLAGLFLFGQRLDLPAVIGLGLIIAGVLVVNLFSQTAPH